MINKEVAITWTNFTEFESWCRRVEHVREVVIAQCPDGRAVPNEAADSQRALIAFAKKLDSCSSVLGKDEVGPATGKSR